MDGTVIVVTRMGLGTTADQAFGVEMLENFFHSVEKLERKPRAVCFYTEGVRCVVEGSPLLMGLKLLEGMGVRLVSCRTCLQRYALADAVAVGETGGMDDIVGLIGGAAKVVTV